MAFERGTLKLGNSVGSKAEMRGKINYIYYFIPCFRKIEINWNIF